MKPVFILSLILSLSSHHVRAQVFIDSSLQQRLSGLESFGDVSSEMLRYYEEQIRGAEDTLVLKKWKKRFKKLNRMLWWNEHFVNVEGKIENRFADMMELHKTEQDRSAVQGRHQPNSWQHDGPDDTVFSEQMGEGIGRMDVIAFHPTDALTMYAGSPNGGLFKTTNGGGTWNAMSSFLPSLGVAAICIHPTNPQTVYILSGDKNSGSNSFVNSYKFLSPAAGVFKTTDGGTTWAKVNTFLDDGTYTSTDMVMHPDNPDILIASTSEGIFRTTNGGSSWTQEFFEFTWDLELKPGSPNTVYAATESTFIKSTNAGQSFSITNSQPLLPLANRISIAVTPANNQIVMLLAGHAEFDLIGVLKSTNSGDDFVVVYNPTDPDNSSDDDLFHNYIDLNVESGQAIYNNTIAISPVDEDIVLVGGLCVWSSDDGGVSWSQETAYWAWSEIFGHEFIHPDQHHLAWHANGTVYVANDGGVYKSNDDGFSWDFISKGLAATQFYHFEFANDEGDTWGGAQDNGTPERESGTTFYNYYVGDGYDQITDHSYNADNGESNDIYYTVNEAVRGDDEDISVPGNINFFGNLGMDPTDEDHIYVGYPQALYESFDAGSTWSSLSTKSAQWAVATCRSNADRIYIAGRENGDGRMTRIDNGVETNLTANLVAAGYDVDLKITDIEVNRTNSNHVYVSTAGFSGTSKVFYSSNGGEFWNNWAINLPNVPVFSLVRDPSGGLYAGTFIGVYYKKSGDVYWQHFSNGLPAVPVSDMELYNFLAGTPNNIMISTFGRGLYKTNTFQTICPDHVTLTGTTFGRQMKDSEITITSSEDIRASLGTIVRYNTGTEIRLIPGFHAKGPGVFKTYLLGCGAELDLVDD